MDFGKRSDLDGVSFTLPPDAPATTGCLASATPPATQDAPWLRMGAPAWARREWLGSLYPLGTPVARFLERYAERLPAIELNATFYREPSEATIASWVKDTPGSFHFCPKFPRPITHDLGLREEALPRALAFHALMSGLGPRLGPYLLQLPPTFAPRHAADLARFVAGFPGPLAVEFRHPDWFVGQQLQPLALRALGKSPKAGTVITDVAGRRDVCHATLTTPTAFVRFVGNALHPSDEARTAVWLDRLMAWRRAGLHTAYWFVHQPDDRLAPELLDRAAALAQGRGLKTGVVRARQLSLL